MVHMDWPLMVNVPSLYNSDCRKGLAECAVGARTCSYSNGRGWVCFHIFI